MTDPQGVLFVCLGNICRSPTAEGLLRAEAERRGVADRVRVGSAGTGSWHVGDPPDARMSEAAARRGYRLAGRARQVTPEDLEEWDLIVAMDGQNLRDLQRMTGPTPTLLRLFSDYLPPGSPTDVPDPYYGGPEGFDRVLDLVEEGSVRILDELVGPQAG